MFCRKCAYDLRHVSSRNCPECGTSFDPSDSASFHSRGRLIAPTGFGYLTLIAGLFIGAALPATLPARANGHFHGPIDYSFALSAVIPIILSALALRRETIGDRLCGVVSLSLVVGGFALWGMEIGRGM